MRGSCIFIPLKEESETSSSPHPVKIRLFIFNKRLQHFIIAIYCSNKLRWSPGNEVVNSLSPPVDHHN